MTDFRIKQGLEAFLKQTAQVIFGADSPLVKEERIAVVQTLSGTGALRVSAEFISMYSPGAMVYISDPSWGNHHTIFRKAGLQVQMSISEELGKVLGAHLAIFYDQGRKLAAPTVFQPNAKEPSLSHNCAC